MESEKRIAVALAVTSDPELLPVVRGMVGGLAAQLGFGDSQQRNLQQGVEQACRRLMEAGDNGTRTVHLRFAGFSDRLEVVLENRLPAEASEADSFLLNQLLDQVTVEQTEKGKLRLTLVKYL